MTIESLQQHLWSFRGAFADHPLVLFVGFLACAAVLHLLWNRFHSSPAEAGPALARSDRRAGVPSKTSLKEAPSRASEVRRLPVIACLAAVLTYAGIAIWYVRLEPFYDFAEPAVAALAWLFHLGRPVYHAFDAAERYSHIYGPMAFAIPAWVLSFAGPSLAASKAVGAAAGLLSLAAVAGLVRRAGDRLRAWRLTALFALVCMSYGNASFWIRPDSLLLMFTALALLAATARHRWIGPVVLGVSAGVMLNLKFTGIFYALPAFALLIVRFGIGPALLAAATAAIALVLPFVLFENVSLANYLFWIRVSAGNGLAFDTFRQNVEWASFLLIPLVPTLLSPAPASLPRAAPTAVYGTLLAGIFGVAVAASKPGAGHEHLLPFWPVILYLASLHSSAWTAPPPRERILRWGRGAFVLTIAVIAMVQQAYFVSVTGLTSNIRAAADLADLVRKHPGRSISMGFGYGEHGDRLTYVRPLLVFETGEYLIDPPAVQEFQLAGLDLPEATIEALKRCRVDLWVFPLGARPFEGPNRYPATEYAPLFSDRFRQAFVDHHEHAHDTRYFQVWRCRQAAGSSRP